jgi:capsular exopolysaccharide synthesis family protein
MDLRIYLEMLWRRKWTILLSAIVAVIVILVGVSFITPTYAATATVRVGLRGGIDYGALNYSERLMNTYAYMVRSSTMTDAAAAQLGLNEISSRIRVRFPDNSELMQIVVQDPDPVLAANVANTLTAILIDQISASRTGQTSIVAMVEPASASTTPAWPNRNLLVAVGLVAGLMGGVGLAFLFEHLDTRLYTTRRIEEVTDLPTLGVIPATSPWRRHAIFIDNSPEAEAFRHLRTSLFTLSGESQLKTLLITSAEPNEGKSMIAANIASSIEQTGKRVLVVDADLRLPTLHKIFHLPNNVGLSSVLKQEVTLEEAIQQHNASGVHVLTSGPTPAQPAELLASAQMVAILSELVQRYDMVVVDTPSLLAVADAASLMPLVDGVLFVVERTHVRQASVEAARQRLMGVKPKTVGLVVNRAERQGSSYYYGRSRTI